MMMMNRTVVVCSAAIAFAALRILPATATEEWPPYVALDVAGSVSTQAFGISDTGDIVGVYATADARTHGFLLTRGVYTSIDIPDAIRTTAVGVSILKPRNRDEDADGSAGGRGIAALEGLAVVGRYDTPDPANPNGAIGHGYVLSNGALASIDHPDTDTFTTANGVNSSGHVVGRYRDRIDGRFRGFLLVDGEFTPIDYPGASAINGIAINDQGDIAGYYQLGATSHAFLLSNGVYSAIDPPAAIGTGGAGGGVGINASAVVGFYRLVPPTLPCGCDGGRAFVFRNGSHEWYRVPGSTSTAFLSINGGGEIVGTFRDGTRIRGLLLSRR